MKDTIYNLYMNIKGTEVKVDGDFKSLMDIDYATSRIKNKKDLLSRVSENKENINIYIKDSNNKTYAIIYNNEFLSKYITERKKSKRLSDNVLNQLHLFIDKIKAFSVSKEKKYLLEPYNVEGLNKFEMKSLKIPTSAINALKKYSKRKQELIDHPHSLELISEFNNDNINIKTNKALISDYNNLRSLIVWLNNYKKIVDKKEQIKKTTATTNNGQVMFPEVERLIKESKSKGRSK